MKIKVKICGITRLEDARLALKLGADELGFILAPSPRRVEPETVRAVLAALEGEVGPESFRAIGVFVNEEPGAMRDIMSYAGLDCRADPRRRDSRSLREPRLPVVPGAADRHRGGRPQARRERMGMPAPTRRRGRARQLWRHWQFHRHVGGPGRQGPRPRRGQGILHRRRHQAPQRRELRTLAGSRRARRVQRSRGRPGHQVAEKLEALFREIRRAAEYLEAEREFDGSNAEEALRAAR